MKIRYSLKRNENSIQFKILEIGEKTKEALDERIKSGGVDTSREGIILFANTVYGSFRGYVGSGSDGVKDDTLFLNKYTNHRKVMKLLPSKIKIVILQMEQLSVG